VNKTKTKAVMQNDTQQQTLKDKGKKKLNCKQKAEFYGNSKDK
jgi:hypothetical protein